MRHLIKFLIRNNHFFLFLLLEVISIGLVCHFNYYQNSVFFTSCNKVAGSVYRMTGGISSYLHLQESNDSLIAVNIQLQRELHVFRQSQKDREDDARNHIALHPSRQKFELIPAHVINNSTRQTNNYITLDKGTSDGVYPEMGVINGDGVVGIVNDASAHYATVLSLLNSKSITSCKLKGSDYFGYLSWKNHDPRYATLFDLPSHAKLSVGDTIMTSGYSAVYPAGIILGTVHKVSYSDDELSYILQIALSTNMSNLSQVRVIHNKEKKKIKELEANTPKK